MNAVHERFASERIDSAVSRACKEHGLDLTHMGSIYAFLDEDEDAWPRCCGSACEPCVATLGSVARRALDLLDAGA